MAYQEYEPEGKHGARQVSQSILQARIKVCQELSQAYLARATYAKEEMEMYEAAAERLKEEFEYHAAIETERFGDSESNTEISLIKT